MEIKELIEIEKTAFINKENVGMQTKYEDAINEYIKGNGVDTELIDVVVKGIDIDGGTTFFDYIDSLNEKDLKQKWKCINLSNSIKEKPYKNTIKFLAGLLYISMTSEGAISNIIGEIIHMIMKLINSKKVQLNIEEYEDAMKQYFVDAFLDNSTIVDWERIKVTSLCKKQFTEMILGILDKEKERTNLAMRRWIREGMTKALEDLKKEKIEEKIPESKVDELQGIVEHYKKVHDTIREYVYEIDKLESKVLQLNEHVNSLKNDNKILERQISELKKVNEGSKEKLEEAYKEIEERKELNEVFDALKENDEKGLLKDIASSLSGIYRDYNDSKDDDMDIELGEIYRELIKEIFDKLAKKGVEVK